jgi:hypothetical protein
MRESDRGVGKGGELGTSSKGSQPCRGAALGEDGRRARGAMSEEPRSGRLHVSTGEAAQATYEGGFGGAGRKRRREGGHTDIEAHWGRMHSHHTLPHHCSPTRGEGRPEGGGAARLCRRCGPGGRDREREREEGGMLAEEGGGGVGQNSKREGRGGRLGLGRGEVGRWHFIREEGRVWASGAVVGRGGPDRSFA